MKTLLCAIARMENIYIREWVEYHKNIGFSNICLYDNNHDGEEHFEDVIGDYIDSGFVILKNYRNKTVCQLEAYTECYSEYGNQYDWIAFLDCDEFLTLKEHKDISQYLSEDVFNDFYSIRLDLVYYGDNDMLSDDGRPVLVRFTTPLPINHEDNSGKLFKVILRGGQRIKYGDNTDGFMWLTPNFTNLIPICNNTGFNITKWLLDNINLGCTIPPNHELAYLKHYSTKTATEYCNKIRRGFPDHNPDDYPNRVEWLIENVFF